MKTRNPITDHEHGIITSLYRNGSGISEIARTVNRLPGTIRNYLIRCDQYNLKWKKRKIDDEELKEIIKLHKLGFNYEDIGRITERTSDCIRKKLIREGIIDIT